MALRVLQNQNCKEICHTAAHSASSSSAVWKIFAKLRNMPFCVSGKCCTAQNFAASSRSAAKENSLRKNWNVQCYSSFVQPNVREVSGEGIGRVGKVWEIDGGNHGLVGVAERSTWCKAGLKLGSPTRVRSGPGINVPHLDACTWICVHVWAIW